MNILESNLLDQSFKESISARCSDNDVFESYYLIGRLKSDLVSLVMIQSRYESDEDIINGKSFDFMKDLIETLISDMAGIVDKINNMVDNLDLEPDDIISIKKYINSISDIISDEKNEFELT